MEKNTILQDQKSKKLDLLKAVINELLETSSESEDELYHLLAENSDSEDDALCKKIIHTYSRKAKRHKGDFAVTEPEFSEEEFFRQYRITKYLFENLLRKYEEHELYKSLRRDKRLPGRLHLQVFLMFASHQLCTFSSISETFKMSKSTVWSIIDRVTAFLKSLSVDVIKWPTAEEKQASASYFDNKYGFSKAIGCIDVTYIAMDTPNGSNASEYVNPKGTSSLCMQAVCDERNRFIDVFVKEPGSKKPNWILHNSPLYANVAGLCEDFYLLGPPSYPCSDWILPPFKNSGNLQSDEEYFNLQHSKAHVIARNSFIMLKTRFKQLKYCKLKNITKLCHFIEACCVLHNLAIDDNFKEIGNDDGHIDNVENTEPDINDQTRTLICEDMWSRRQARN